MSEKVKVLVVETINNNLGDPVLADNNCYLLKKAFSDRPFELFRHRISTVDPDQLSYVDAVFFAGGIIKTATEKFWLHISNIVTLANQLGLPVFFSSVGAEPFDGSDEALTLRKALNLPCVKGISIRDDINSFLNGWHLNPDIPYYSTYDPAIWCPYTYHVKPKPASDNAAPKRIGLGVVRYQLFSDYGHPEIDREFQLDFWRDVALLLEKKGYEWALFTNGAGPDEDAAREVIAHIGHGEVIPTPMEGAHLVNNINLFDGVIAGRMHSSIISYSLGIPCIGFVWNQKLFYWGEKIGHPERLVGLENMNPEYVTDRLDQAVKEGIHEVYEDQYNGVYDAIKRFVDDWCKPKTKAHLPLDFSKKTTAIGLGSILKRNPRTNSLEAFEYSREHGYKIFELDINLTADNVPVCLGTWNAKTRQVLGIPADSSPLKPVLEDFKKLKTYYRYPAISFTGFLDHLMHYGNEKMQILIDVRAAASEKPKELFLKLHEEISKRNLPGIRFSFLVARDSDIRALKELKLKYDILYFLPYAGGPELSRDQIDAFYLCRRHRIKYIAMEEETYTPPVQEMMDRRKMEAFILSAEKVGAIIRLMQDNRIRYIGSSRYDVTYMTDLTR